MAGQHHSSSSTLPFCNVMTPVTLFPAEQQDLESTLLTVLYSNVRSLRQAYGKLCTAKSGTLEIRRIYS